MILKTWTDIGTNKIILRSGDGSLIRKQHLVLKIEDGLPES